RLRGDRLGALRDIWDIRYIDKLTGRTYSRALYRALDGGGSVPGVGGAHRGRLRGDGLGDAGRSGPPLRNDLRTAIPWRLTGPWRPGARPAACGRKQRWRRGNAGRPRWR